MRRGLLPFVVGTAVSVASAVVVSASVVVACSAEGLEAPRVIAPDEDTGACPSGDAVLLSLKGELNAGAFDALRPDLERTLVDEGGLKTLLALVAAVLPELTGGELNTVLSVLASDDGKATVAAFKPHVLNVLHYLNGTSEFIAGKHDAPLRAAHEILVSCDAAEQVRTLRDVLALEVNHAPPGTPAGEPAWIAAAPGAGESSFLFALIDAVDRAADIPVMRGLLERIEIEEDGAAGGGDDIVIGRAAFVVLAKLLAANIAAPDFQLAPTRELLEQVMVPQLDGDASAEAALDELLDLLGLLVETDSATFKDMQALMGCVDRHDDEAAIAGLLFDYMTIDELPLQDLLDDVTTSARGDGTTALRLAIVDVLDGVLLHPDILGDATSVLARLLAPEVADTTLTTVLSLEGKGVLTELLEFVDVLLTCKDVPL